MKKKRRPLFLSKEAISTTFLSLVVASFSLPLSFRYMSSCVTHELPTLVRRNERAVEGREKEMTLGEKGAMMVFALEPSVIHLSSHRPLLPCS